MNQYVSKAVWVDPDAEPVMNVRDGMGAPALSRGSAKQMQAISIFTLPAPSLTRLYFHISFGNGGTSVNNKMTFYLRLKAPLACCVTVTAASAVVVPSYRSNNQ